MTTGTSDPPPAPPVPSDEAKTRGANGGIARAWRELLRGILKPRTVDGLRETIDRIIETHEEHEAPAPVSPHERVLLANLLKFRTLTAEDVCVPRADIVAVEASAGLDEMVGAFVAQQHSRMPVYRETLDDVIGMVHVKDVVACLAAGRPFDLRAILRRVLFVARRPED